jgi:intein/homing endonuclease
LQKISPPRHSKVLAELLGIIAGDGHISEYQTSVSTHSETDIEHALYTKQLFEKLFRLRVSLSYRKKQKACTVVVSSKEVCKFLAASGMTQGHKIKTELRMPVWIRKQKSCRLAFTKGLFDTDGCVYTDTLYIKGREYKNIGMAFTNQSLPLLTDLKTTLESLDLHPTQKTKYTVFLRRKDDIQQYFRVVGSSNPKHFRKAERYLPPSK